MDVFSTGYTSATMLADVGEAVQTTFASIAPILVVVVGIILTFIVARYVISLFRHTGRTK
jgi:hypothetical protein